MVTVNIKSASGDTDTVKELILEGLKEEKNRVCPGKNYFYC